MTIKFSLSQLIYEIRTKGYVHDDDIERTLRHFYGDYNTIEDGLERYFTENRIIDALINVVGYKHRLLDIARAISDNKSVVSDELSSEQVATIILNLLGAPVLPAPEQCKGVSGILNDLNIIKSQIRYIARTDRDYTRFRGNTIEGWAYVEHALKLTLGFYRLVFDNILTEEFTKLQSEFKKASEIKSLGPILYAMKGLQKRFEDESPEGKFAREICKRYLSKNTPFEGFNFDYYIENIGECRNFFAHSIREALAQAGLDRVLKSINIALGLIENIIVNNISPLIIVPTIFGYDVYMRRIVWFISEDVACQNEWLDPQLADSWMYKDWDQYEIRFFQPYLVSRVRHTMCDPLLYELEEVLDRLS